MPTARTLPKMLFISPRFLFPMDTGGQIRTGQILRHLNNKHFNITLICPATVEQINYYAEEIKTVCQTFIPFRAVSRHGLWGKCKRIASLFNSLPVSVMSDISPELRRLVAQEQKKGYDVVVYDFIHSTVNFVDSVLTKTVVFTHNVEHEIYRRYADISGTPWRHAIWQAQFEKMKYFEETALQLFDRILAVSEKDSTYFQKLNPNFDIRVIPTGVDLRSFPYSLPNHSKEIVFVGSMDYWSNIEGVAWFLREVWPSVNQKHAEATIKIIGRYPPAGLVKEFARDPKVRFTGWVGNTYREAKTGGAHVVPLRVGSGTRIKVFEAMAMGIPVVSTGIGVEGLSVQPDEHYLKADFADAFIGAIDALFTDIALRRRLSRNAHWLVKENYSWEKVAAIFAACCRFPAISPCYATTVETATIDVRELVNFAE